MRVLFRIVGFLVLIIVLLVGAGLGYLVYDAHRLPTGTSEYVALGSSFAAAPGVGARDASAPLLCERSAENYAHRLAQKRGLSLTDMTCSGATTINVVQGGQYFQGPQIDALRAATRLVTVTVGGNDVSYLGNLTAWSCTSRPEDLPWIIRPLFCTVTPPEVVQQKLGELGASMQAIVDAVRQKSPQAQLVFVDYTSILPDTGSCPDRLPLTDAELAQARALATQLAATTADIARRNNATLVKASDVTRGHDVCSAEPWNFGWVMAGSPLDFGPVPYHPTGKAMQAIADAIDHALGPPAGTSS